MSQNLSSAAVVIGALRVIRSLELLSFIGIFMQKSLFDRQLPCTCCSNHVTPKYRDTCNEPNQELFEIIIGAAT